MNKSITGRLNFTIALIVILSMVSCIEDNAGQSGREEAVDRVVVVYLCGDNDLSSEIKQKIDALMQGMSRVDNTHNHLIIYADSKNEMPKLWKINSNGNTLLKEYTERNSASPHNFGAIMKQIITDYPAESYGLICFSHASGWLPKGALNNPTGFEKTQTTTRTIFDDNGSEMSLEEFAEAIPAISGGRKMEFIVFETCYMASVEAAWVLRNKTKYIVASSAEMLSDGLVGIYPDALHYLFDPKPELTAFCQTYFYNWDANEGTKRSATISLINTAPLDDLAQTVQDIAAGNTLWTTNVDPATVQHFNRNAHRLMFDLGHLVAKTATAEQLNAFNAALSRVVEYEAATPRFMHGSSYSFTIERHSGLTTYIVQDEFPALNDLYYQTAWHKRIMAN